MKTVLYFYDNSFAMVRRRLAGIMSAARDLRWHVEPIDMTGRIQMPGKLLRFWCPDGVIVHGALARHAAFRSDAFDTIPTVWCDASMVSAPIEGRRLCRPQDAGMRIRQWPSAPS